MKLFEIMGDITFDQDVEDEEGPNYEEIVTRLAQDAEANGGFTVNANTFDDANHQDGYQVAIPDFETKADLDDIELMIEAAKEINAFINQQSSNNLYVGGWIADGQLWFDVSQYVQDLDEAMALGRARKQKAIFDNANMEEIMLDGSDEESDEMDDEFGEVEEFDSEPEMEVGDEFGDDMEVDDVDDYDDERSFR